MVERLDDGVFAYVQPDGSWWVNNAGFISDDGRTLLIDTTSTERRTRALLAAVEAHTGGAPVRTVINTHWHGDHTNGNCLLPEATVIAHGGCRDDVARGRIGGLDGIWDPIDWGDLVVRPPDLVFHDRVELRVGGIDVEVRHPGHSAHTDDDCVVWLPGPRVLFTGDLVFHGGTPFVLMGSVRGSLRAIDWMRSFDADVVVPGHGPVCNIDVLDDIEEYLIFVDGLAAAGVSAGLTPLEVATGADLSRFADLTDPERLAGNLHRAYSERTGKPVDGLAAFADMLALNGGPMRTHA